MVRYGLIPWDVLSSVSFVFFWFSVFHLENLGLVEIFWSPFSLLLIFVPLGAASAMQNWGDGWTFVLNFIAACLKTSVVFGRYGILKRGVNVFFQSNTVDPWESTHKYRTQMLRT